MGRSMKQVTIEGKTYSVTPWSGTKAARMLAKLVKLLGPALGKLMGSAGSFKELLAKKSGDVDFAAVFMSLSERIDEEQFDTLMKDLLDGVFEGPKAVTDDFDSRFSGGIMTAFKLIRVSLEVNYGDFLGVIGKASRSQVAPAE